MKNIKFQVRIIFLYKNNKTKFLRFFCGNDNSFYFHPYRNIKNWQYPSFKKTEDFNLNINFSEIEKSSFKFNKISIHPKGYIHMTDTNGKRLRDNIRFPIFSNIKTPYDCVVFVSPKPDNLPKFTNDKNTKDLTIELPDNVKPFYFVISIIDSSNPPSPQPGYYIPQPLNFVFPAQPLGLSLTMHPVKTINKNAVQWPSIPFHLFRTG